MSFPTKLLPMLALVVSLTPLAAQARNGDPRLMHHDNTTFSECWVTDFGFLGNTCKPAVCKDVQKGFWPRPNDCVN